MLPTHLMTQQYAHSRKSLSHYTKNNNPLVSITFIATMITAFWRRETNKRRFSIGAYTTTKYYGNSRVTLPASTTSTSARPRTCFWHQATTKRSVSGTSRRRDVLPRWTSPRTVSAFLPSAGRYLILPEWYSWFWRKWLVGRATSFIYTMPGTTRVGLFRRSSSPARLSTRRWWLIGCPHRPPRRWEARRWPSTRFLSMRVAAGSWSTPWMDTRLSWMDTRGLFSGYSAPPEATLRSRASRPTKSPYWWEATPTVWSMSTIYRAGGQLRHSKEVTEVIPDQSRLWPAIQNSPKSPPVEPLKRGVYSVHSAPAVV